MGGPPSSEIGGTSKGTGRSLWGSWRKAEGKLNHVIADSGVGKYFKLEARESNFIKEVRAGVTTFVTMMYIISVNAAILVNSGGPCTVRDCTPMAARVTNSSSLLASPMHPGPECKFDGNPGYESCLARTRKDLVVATSLAAMFGSFAMGAIANLPLAIAPGMGTNAYFTYNMVGLHGTGLMSYGTALGAILLEGLLFLTLSVLGLRSKLARLIPRSIRLASAVGIGFFLAFTGLQSDIGLGLVGPSKSTLVTLAACVKKDAVTGECLSSILGSPTLWLGTVGFIITTLCLAKEVKGSIIYGVVFVTIVSWFRGTSVTAFPNTDIGNSNYEYFKKVVDFHMIRGTAGKISFSGLHNSRVWLAIVTLLYVDILDTTGSMFSMAEHGGFIDDSGGFEGEYRAFIVDASTTIVSAALGTTTVTTFTESTAGIKEGGRTGLTTMTVAFLFLVSLFFGPLFTNVPPWAIGQALVIVGAMMAKLVKEIEWADMKEAVPAFLTITLIPLTYSISNGIIAGLGMYAVLKLHDYVVKGCRWAAKVACTRNQMSGDANATTAERIPPSQLV